MSEILIPRTPAELAGGFVDVVNQGSAMVVNDEEQKTLIHLDQLTDMLDFSGSYITDANKGMAIPESFDRSLSVRYIDYERVIFRGTLECYAIVKIGRLIGASSSIRALCLSFTDVNMFSKEQEIPKEHRFFVPALAVEYMDRVA